MKDARPLGSRCATTRRDNPGTWRYAERATRKEVNGTKRVARRSAEDQAEGAATASLVTTPVPHELRATELMDYPYPLRDGMMIRLAAGPDEG